MFCRLAIVRLIYFISTVTNIIKCNSVEPIKNIDPIQNVSNIEKVPLSNHDPPANLEIANSNDNKDITNLKETVKDLNDQLQNFNSLYINRLDQKLTTLVSNIASIDSNVKNIQERAHVWDTFQLHVSAWNDQIKSMDRKVDIINSGQEKMSLLESKLSILLNLEYNSARIVNKLTSLEDRLDQIERTLRRQQTEISNMNSRDTSPSEEQQVNKNTIPIALKTIEKKTDRLIGMLQRNTPLGRKFARGKNGTHSPQRIVIKCTTPPTVEEIVKDVQSKVDLIYDKILTDNISSNDDCNMEDERKNNENSDEIEEDIEPDYPIIVFNSDEDNSEEKKFKRQTRSAQETMSSKNYTRTKRSQQDFNKNLQNEIDEIKSLIEKNLQNTFYQNDISADIQNITSNIQLIINLIQNNHNIENSIGSNNIDLKLEQIKTIFKNVCDYLQNKFTIGYHSEFKKYCFLFMSPNKSKKIAEFEDCMKKNEITKTIDKQTSSNIPINWQEPEGLDKVNFNEEFWSVCQEFVGVGNFSLAKKKINTPRELTCIIVYIKSSFLINFYNFCTDPKPSFCDDQSFIIFQSRMSDNVSFARNWTEYKWGFGDFQSGNYWIGNEALHTLTNDDVRPTILKINMEDFDGNSAWAEYDRFSISSESNSYTIQLSGYRGNASNGLSYHNGAAFSTIDSRHDEAPECCPCANSYGKGGWWYRSCFESNLNGIYFNKPTTLLEGGISWESWSPNSTLSKSTMALGLLKSTDANTNYEIEDP